MPKRPFSFTDVACSASVALLLGMCVAAVLVRQKGEWLVYAILVVLPAIGSLWGIQGRRFAFLGAILAGALGSPLMFCALIVAEDDWELFFQETV